MGLVDNGLRSVLSLDTIWNLDKLDLIKNLVEDEMIFIEKKLYWQKAWEIFWGNIKEIKDQWALNKLYILPIDALNLAILYAHESVVLLFCCFYFWLLQIWNASSLFCKWIFWDY